MTRTISRLAQKIDILIWTLLGISAVLVVVEYFAEIHLHPSRPAFTFRDYHGIVILLTLCVQFVLLAVVRRVLRRQRDLEANLSSAKAEAEAGREKLEAILEAIADPISIQDTGFTILFQNRAHKEWKGDHLGEFCCMAYNGRTEPREDCPLAPCFLSGDVHRTELQSDGRYLQFTSCPLKDASGAVTAGIEIIRDISDMKQAEQTQARHSLFLRQLLDAIPTAVFYRDAAGTYLGCNVPYENLLGLSREEIIGRSVEDLFPAGRAGYYREKDRELLERGGVQTFEQSVELGGEKKEIIFTNATFCSADLEPAGVVGVVVDQTERKQKEEEIRKLYEGLQQMNRELEAFSYSLSHDLRNPLSIVIGGAEALLLQHRHSLSDEGEMLLEGVLESGKRIDELIEAMLVLSGIGTAEMVREEVDLSALAEEVLLELRAMDPFRCTMVTVEPCLRAVGDPNLLRIAFSNLLHNAWKFTGKTEDPWIEVGYDESFCGGVFFVRDNGAGFDSADLNRLFRPFQRLHSCRDFPGTGIGLATVQRVIDRHGGSIWCEGAPGAGATFYFSLPCGGRGTTA